MSPYGQKSIGQMIKLGIYTEQMLISQNLYPPQKRTKEISRKKTSHVASLAPGCSRGAAAAANGAEKHRAFLLLV